MLTRIQSTTFPLSCLLAALAALSSTERALAQDPVAVDDFDICVADTSVEVIVLINDYGFMVPLDYTTVTVSSAPAHGSTFVDTNQGTIIYTPEQGWLGIDTFMYHVYDYYGQKSNDAYVDILTEENDPPVINSFDYYDQGYGYYSWFGNVSDEYPQYVTVHFTSNIPEVDGKSTDCNIDGDFEHLEWLERGENGDVWADAQDDVGQWSDTAYVYMPSY